MYYFTGDSFGRFHRRYMNRVLLCILAKNKKILTSLLKNNPTAKYLCPPCSYIALYTGNLTTIAYIKLAANVCAARMYSERGSPRPLGNRESRVFLSLRALTHRHKFLILFSVLPAAPLNTRKKQKKMKKKPTAKRLYT